METLPIEILRIIIKKVDKKSLLNLRKVNKTLYNICCSVGIKVNLTILSMTPQFSSVLRCNQRLSDVTLHMDHHPDLLYINFFNRFGFHIKRLTILKIKPLSLSLFCNILKHLPNLEYFEIFASCFEKDINECELPPPLKRVKTFIVSCETIDIDLSRFMVANTIKHLEVRAEWKTLEKFLHTQSNIDNLLMTPNNIKYTINTGIQLNQLTIISNELTSEIERHDIDRNLINLLSPQQNLRTCNVYSFTSVELFKILCNMKNLEMVYFKFNKSTIIFDANYWKKIPTSCILNLEKLDQRAFDQLSTVNLKHVKHLTLKIGKQETRIFLENILKNWNNVESLSYDFKYSIYEILENCKMLRNISNFCPKECYEPHEQYPQNYHPQLEILNISNCHDMPRLLKYCFNLRSISITYPILFDFGPELVSRLIEMQELKFLMCVFRVKSMKEIYNCTNLKALFKKLVGFKIEFDLISYESHDLITHPLHVDADVDVNITNRCVRYSSNNMAQV